MDQEKVGKFILKLRKDNNLTQKELADKLGVTYQAVSKWETGKNIPDIAIIRLICEEFNVDINDVLDLKPNTKKSNNKYYIIACIVFIIIVISIICVILYNNDKKKHNFEFKNIEAACDNFKVYGNMAYNSNSSYLSISKIEYCGDEDNVKYKKIDCNLYKINDSSEEIISDCGYTNDEPVTLEEYLNNVKIDVDNYSSMCSYYVDSNLQLKIEAVDSDDKIITYKIPIKVNDSCKK